tara:strand:- start:1819 stop:2427 length:609 start_codon:yes stop_codon:yes gene_type:complete
MQTKYSYWLFKDALSEKDRNKIKKIAKKSTYKESQTEDQFSTNEERKKYKDQKIRNSDITFSSDQYLYDTLCPLVMSANEEAGWKYDLDWFEAVQISRYRKNQHFTWHRDGSSDHLGAYSDGKNTKGKIRKISLVACLSNGYVGGDFELALQEQKRDNEILYPEMKMGDVIVFPSYVFHRSAPITKGIKYSLSMWCLGPPFR